MPNTRFPTRTIIAGTAGTILAALVAFVFPAGSASVFGGGTIIDGINAIRGIGGLYTGTVNNLIVDVTQAILSVVTIIAVFTIVIAGMFLILSVGEEGQKDKAKKIIQYTITGLIVILLAQIIIDLVFSVFSGNPGSTQRIVTNVLMVLLMAVLNVITVIAVAVIIVAGIYLIISNGDEGQKDKAKNIIIYAIVGLIVILLSRVIVIFVSSLL